MATLSTTHSRASTGTVRSKPQISFRIPKNLEKNPPLPSWPTICVEENGRRRGRRVEVEAPCADTDDQGVDDTLASFSDAPYMWKNPGVRAPPSRSPSPSTSSHTPNGTCKHTLLNSRGKEPSLAHAYHLELCPVSQNVRGTRKSPDTSALRWYVPPCVTSGKRPQDDAKNISVSAPLTAHHSAEQGPRVRVAT